MCALMIPICVHCSKIKSLVKNQDLKRTNEGSTRCTLYLVIPRGQKIPSPVKKKKKKLQLDPTHLGYLLKVHSGMDR